MTEHRYLVDYVVESHVCIPKGIGRLVFKHPSENLEVHLRNQDVDPPVERPTLSVQVILSAESIEEAEEVSREKLRSFLELLSFVAQSRLWVQRLNRVVEWDPGLQERQCIQIDEFPDPNIPFQVLDNNLLESVATIAASGFAAQFAQALRWFRQGVSAKYTDEQFQYFWFTLEILAQMKKTTNKVPDRCPHCRQPLYCQTCGEIPTHRPYPGQVIEHLIERHMKGDQVPKLIEMAKRVRNAILHGKDPDGVLADTSYSFEALLNFVGKAAWVALMDSIQKTMQETGKAGRLKLLRPTSYHHRYMQLRTDLSVSVRDPDNPCVDDLPPLQVTLQVHEGPRHQSDVQSDKQGND